MTPPTSYRYARHARIAAAAGRRGILLQLSDDLPCNNEWLLDELVHLNVVEHYVAEVLLGGVLGIFMHAVHKNDPPS